MLIRTTKKCMKIWLWQFGMIALLLLLANRKKYRILHAGFVQHCRYNYPLGHLFTPSAIKTPIMIHNFLRFKFQQSYIFAPLLNVSVLKHSTLILSVLCFHSILATNTSKATTFRTNAFNEKLSDSLYLPQEWRIGLLGGLTWLQHRSLLAIVPGKQECCNYESGTATGFWGGISLDYALLPEHLEFGTRFLFARKPFALQETIAKFERFNGIDAYETLQRSFSYYAVPDFITADLGVRFQPFSSLPFYLRLSGDATFSPSVQIPVQETELILTRNALFPENNAQSRTNTREAAQISRWNFGITGAFGVEIPLFERLLIGAETSYRYGLTTVRSDIDWRTNSLQGSLTLRWRFIREEVLPRQKEEIPAQKLPQPQTLSKPLQISSFQGTPLEIQETIVTQTFPLLPYIFFDSSSTVVRNRYNPRIGPTAQFDEQALPKETLSIYYHILHIVGKRMRQNPASTITITGTTDGKEWSNANSRQILAMQRARAVASFLTGYWGIAANRIKLSTRDTPELASSARYAEGNEENRRVELSSSDPELLRPVVHFRFLEYTPVRTEHYMQVQLEHPESAQSYKGSIEAFGETFAISSGINAPPERLPFGLRRKFTAKLAQTLGTLSAAECTLQVLDNDGKSIIARTAIDVKTSQNQYELSRLNLIVFDFDRDDMAEANRIMMQRFVNDAIKPTSRISVIGSTDKLGELRYNQELSTSRAKGVQDFMRRLNSGIIFDEVRGTGASVLPFDNDLPEGRYYCRTVSITVQTPRK